MITLKPITLTSPDMPTCLDLDVAPEKEDYVRPTSSTLAMAHRRFKRFCKAMECRAVYANGQMVGLLSYFYSTEGMDFKDYEEACYVIRPIMVDKNHLGKGYEKEALLTLVEELRTKPNGEAVAIFAFHAPEEADRADLFQSVGFVKTDMKWEDPDDGDIITCISL